MINEFRVSFIGLVQVLGQDVYSGEFDLFKQGHFKLLLGINFLVVVTFVFLVISLAFNEIISLIQHLSSLFRIVFDITQCKRFEFAIFNFIQFCDEMTILFVFEMVIARFDRVLLGALLKSFNHVIQTCDFISDLNCTVGIFV